MILENYLKSRSIGIFTGRSFRKLFPMQLGFFRKIPRVGVLERQEDHPILEYGITIMG